MKKKKINCPNCGVKYNSKKLRCPACEFLKPVEGIEPGDRFFGLLLIIIGIVLAVPAFGLIYASMMFGGVRGRSAATIFCIIPIGTVFHGILFLNGIHPKEFYKWWDNLPPLVRGMIWAFLATIALILVFVYFFGDFPDDD